MPLKRFDKNEVSELPSLLGKNLRFLHDWSSANEAQFEKVMTALAEEKPEVWVNIYLKVQQVLMPKNGRSNTVNLNINKDSATLKTLAQTTVQSVIPTKDADYEEIKD